MWMKSLLRVVTVSFLAIALLPHQLAAEQATAQIGGKVTDSSGAIIVGARVTLTNPNTGISHQAAANKDGEYLFTLVPIGSYDLKV